MALVDVQGHALPDLRIVNPDFGVDGHHADRCSEKDKIRLYFRDRAGEQHMCIRSGRWGLAHLEIELKVVDSDHGIRPIHFNGQRVSIVMRRKSFLVCAGVNGLFSGGGPPEQSFARVSR